jgi:hypothetical protein
MSHMARRPRDYIAPTLFGVAIAGNYAIHKTDWAATACMNCRRLLRTDTVPGKLAAAAAIAGFVGWFAPHFIFGPLEHEND